MTYQHQHHEYIYKAIVALNNTGVYLINHGLYSEAIETLQDSMRFMKETFFRSDNNMQGMILDLSHRIDRLEYETALQASWRRKSLVNKHRHRYRNEEMSRTNRVGISIVVVSDQDHPLQVHDTLMQQCRSSTSFCCATIDLVPNFDVLGSNFDQLQQQSALILYNLGIAYRCIAVIHQPIVVLATNSNTGNRIALTTSISMYNDYLAMSYHLVKLSCTITYSMLQELPSRGVGIVYSPLSLLLVSLLVLHSLQQISIENECLFDQHLHYRLALDNMVAVVATRFLMMTGEGENQTMFRAPAA